MPSIKTSCNCGLLAYAVLYCSISPSGLFAILDLAMLAFLDNNIKSGKITSSITRGLRLGCYR